MRGALRLVWTGPEGRGREVHAFWRIVSLRQLSWPVQNYLASFELHVFSHSVQLHFFANVPFCSLFSFLTDFRRHIFLHCTRSHPDAMGPRAPSSCCRTHEEGSKVAMPENREIEKKETLFFFCQRHALSTSFNIFVVTHRETNFLPKLADILLFSTEKTEFPFFEFPYFRVLPYCRDLVLSFVWIWAHTLSWCIYLRQRFDAIISAWGHTSSLPDANRPLWTGTSWLIRKKWWFWVYIHVLSWCISASRELIHLWRVISLSEFLWDEPIPFHGQISTWEIGMRLWKDFWFILEFGLSGIDLYPPFVARMSISRAYKHLSFRQTGHEI